MSSFTEILFNTHDLSVAFENMTGRIPTEVDAIQEAQFLHCSDEEIIAHLLPKFEVIPLELHEDARAIHKSETQVQVKDFGETRFVPGLSITVEIPFTGGHSLWRVIPSTFTSSPPRGRVVGATALQGALELVFERSTGQLGDGTGLKNEIEQTISHVRRYIEWIKRDVDSHNGRVRDYIQQAITSRRQRLGKYADVINMLGIPLKQKEGAPAIETLPIQRNLVRPLPPAPNTTPEPGIRDEDYNHILGVIRHEGRTFENAPQTFAKHDEEELRDIILAHLNGHYQGQATGETFRKTGKTDIRIEAENRAAFVAECKVWSGPAELLKAVGQLLGYLTWRDCKGALILFNKHNAGFSEVQEKVPEALKGHALCENQITANIPAGEWKFKFKSVEDPKRLITLHVFVFNLFVQKSKRS